MIRILFLALFTAAVSLAIYLFFYLGFYKPVDIGIAERPAMNLLFKPHTGAYHLIGPVIREVEAWSAQNHVACDKTFGEYIDDPDAVDQDRLRSRGGCLVAGPVEIKPPDFQYETRPGRKYVVAHFSGSPSIGPFKVYPKVHAYFAKQKLKSTQPVIEVYTVHDNTVETEFLFPLD
jgi:AraC family transcriptional regulator